ncbi:LuxR C-terminal-related transcriptional regulator [Streptomyces violarus]|uniref:LuxR C-terminal-related transcriptional regulator n=1 Tax=Streptomyces violarus TaxID=67380 RepID=UPI0021C0A865|nr:LuxR C-terminal-related transcriptional regulator [Streptomyces violarus]MCT9143706.1 LuxR C-terminal-related transcriptional regulator [Streptomyces violarus]
MGGSAPRRDHQLSAETTSFVDRRGELTEGRELLARARLVTLTGPGGVGKTRLAARIAARVRRAFPDGVRFVHLSGLHDPALVPLAAADALGLHDHSAQPPLDALVEQVRDRRLLLVVDNCEHLAGACAQLAAALLHGTGGVRILATSRHRLGLTEEHLLEVRPLPVPDPDGDLSAAEGYPALTLFADRAAAVVPGFRLTPGNLASVARLCRRLDGLPLAIELAAVRMRVLDVDQLLDRLDDRYRFLTTGSPAALPRHQTLRAAVAWSHDLCTGPEQVVWARLSVLAGAFDLETAEAVCADDMGEGDAGWGTGRAPAGVLLPEGATGFADDAGSRGAAAGERPHPARALTGPTTPPPRDDGPGHPTPLPLGPADAIAPRPLLRPYPLAAPRSADGPDSGMPPSLVPCPGGAPLSRGVPGTVGVPLSLGVPGTVGVPLSLGVPGPVGVPPSRGVPGPGGAAVPSLLTLSSPVPCPGGVAASPAVSGPGGVAASLAVSGPGGVAAHPVGEAVHAVGEWHAGPGPVGLRADEVLDAVAGLVDKSVLCREPGPGGVRYRMLDTLRQYGLERLRRTAGEEGAARRRQRDRMLRRVEDCERGWFGPGQPETVARLRADRDNLRAALDFSLSTPGEERAGLRLAGTLWFYWHACGAPREGLYWLDRALAAGPEPTRERARGLWVAGLLAATTQDFPRGHRQATEALALARALGDPAEAAHAEYVIGVIRLFGDDLPGALTHFESTVARGPVPGQHLSLVGLDQVELACALGFLGEADRAVEICEQALRLCERHGEQWVRSYVLRILALAHTVRRDWPRAERHAREALRLKHAVHDIIGMALTLDLLASIAGERGAHRHAALLMGGADRVWADIDTGRWGAHTLNSVRRDSEERACRALGRDAFERAHRRGGGLGLAELVGQALQEPARPRPGDSPAPHDDTTVRLTRRETEVARLVAEGLANQQIADRLVIARRTAEGHVERILSKLGFSNRSQIAAWVTAQR